MTKNYAIEKVKPVRVQMDFSNKSSGTFRYFDIFKSKYPDMKITKNKSMTKIHLDMNVRWFNKTTKTYDIKKYGGYDISIENALYGRIVDMLGNQTGFIFHGSNIKICAPMKCKICDGTGKSYYPSDSFNSVIGKR